MPLKIPPVTEEEAVEAVTAMNRYQSHKRGAWHTQEHPSPRGTPPPSMQ